MIQIQYNIIFSFQRFMLGGVIMEAGETYLISHIIIDIFKAYYIKHARISDLSRVKYATKHLVMKSVSVNTGKH